MSSFHSAEQQAIAAQLVADLAAYDAGLSQLLERRWDPQLYRELAELFDRMQMQAETLPGLAVRWIELLISRAELMQALWSMRAPTRINGRVEALHAQHRLVLEQLREGCSEYLAPPAGVPSELAPPGLRR